MVALSDIQRTVVREVYAAFFKPPTLAQKAWAKKVMLDPEAPATVVFIAARYLLGEGFTAYEPDTLWRELDPCLINRDKLMAAIALALTPSFYWDYRVFGATTHALNHERAAPEDVPHCTPAQMAWAAFEAELLFALSDGDSTRPDFDPCVEAYVGVSLFDEGFVHAPVGLGFAADELKNLVKRDSLPFAEEVTRAWAALPKDNIPEKFENTALGVQLFRLTSVWQYVLAQTQHLRRALPT